ncbi:MAG: acyltransferase [Microbacteriaceae bacterium]|nr:acyltransferase [Microbacteriaceae bacterium]
MQGLRTVALLLVAVYHIWFDRVSGGVDVFLLVSAYLLTRSLTGRAERDDLTNPATFAVRKFARLLPAAVTTIVLTLIASYLLLPASMWADHARDAIASLTYTENLRLQSAGADYFAANDAMTSPFQHFWSLAIQGQVFVLWALIHAAVERAARATGRSLRGSLIAVFAVILIASLVWSVRITAADQVYAYFDTWARLWEFAAGSLLALVQPMLRVPAPLRAASGWLGLAGIVSCGWVIAVEGSFPGYAALWPVVSAMLVILSAGERTRFGADRLLASPLLARAGTYSYALYLTHWPVLITLLVVSGTAQANWWQGALVLAASAALSAAIVHLVELPVDTRLRRREKWQSARHARPEAPSRLRRAAARRRGVVEPSTRTGAIAVLRPRRLRSTGLLASTAVILVAVLLGLGSSAALSGAFAKQRASQLDALEQLDYSALGANAPELELDDAGTLQGAAVLKSNWVRPGVRCVEGDPYYTHSCFLAPAIHGGEPERLILAVGSSHVNQYSAMLTEVVNRRPTWAMYTLIAPACTLEKSQDEQFSQRARCEETWSTARELIDAEQPDLVVALGTLSTQEGDVEMAGLVEWIESAAAASPGTRFVTIRDSPRTDRDMAECVLASSYADPECIGLHTVGDPTPFREPLERAGTIWIDLNEHICSADGTCAPQRGGIATYLDTHHITAAYARTLAGPFAAQLSGRLDWWPADPYEGDYLDPSDRDLDVTEVLNK